MANPLNAFDQDGFAVVENFFDADTASRLIGQAKKLAAAHALGPESAVFSTRTHEHAANRYFLNSADSIKCFMEEDAFDEEGQLKQPLAQFQQPLAARLLIAHD